MRFVCDSCRAQYMISDDKVGPKGVKVRCKKCGFVILVRRATDAAPAPVPDGGDDEAGTQVMSNPLASLGASLDQELTNPNGASAPAAKAEPDPNSLLGASEDEIGAVFDSVLNSGVQKIPGAPEDGEEKTQASMPGALGDDDDDRMSTRVLDVESVKKLAAEAALDESGPKAASNGEAKNGDAKKDKDTDHDWYVAIDEKQVGPLKKEAVKEKWEAGEITPDSLCWRAGFSDWIPVSEAAELASVLAPRPNKPMIGGSSPMPQPSVVSVPVESAFSSGGVTRTVRSEVQVPMAAAGASGEEAPSGWKPSAASALASLVRDEIDALDKPSAPPPASSPSSGEGAMALGGGLLDLPPADAPAPHAGMNGKSALFDDPAPAPAQAARAPMNGTGGYAPAQMQMQMQMQPPPQYAQPYAPYPVAPPQGGGNKTLIVIGAVVVALLLVMGGLIIFLVTRQNPQPAVAPQNQVAMNQLSPPAEAVRETPKAEEMKAAPVEDKKVEEKPAEKPAEGAARTEEKPAEKKTEEKVERVADRGVDMPKKTFVPKNTVASASTRKTEADDVGTITAGKTDSPPKKVEEPKGTDDEFAAMFGGGAKKSEAKEAAAAKVGPKPKKTVWVPGEVGDGAPALDRLGQSDITQAILGNLAGIKKCIAEQKAKDPGLTGPIVMKFTIQTSGKVGRVSVGSEEHKSSYLGGCLGAVIKSTTFPKHRTQGPEVNFPFKF